MGLCAAGLPLASAGVPAAPVTKRRRSRLEPAAPVEPVRSAPEIEIEPEAPAAPVEPAWQPTVLRREEWTPLAPADNHRALGTVNRLTVHHTGADTRSMGVPDIVTVQRIEAYHRDELGWACIGYHFLIGHDGTIYQGRPLDVQGAHVRDDNEGNLGVSLIGKFDEAPPSDEQLRSLAYVLADAELYFGIGRRQVFAHRELSPTTCPGDQLFRWLQHYRRG